MLVTTYFFLLGGGVNTVCKKIGHEEPPPQKKKDIQMKSRLNSFIARDLNTRQQYLGGTVFIVYSSLHGWNCIYILNSPLNKANTITLLPLIRFCLQFK